MVKLRTETASEGSKTLESIYYRDTESPSRAVEPWVLTEPSRRTRQAEPRARVWSRDQGRSARPCWAKTHQARVRSVGWFRDQKWNPTHFLRLPYPKSRENLNHCCAADDDVTTPIPTMRRHPSPIPTDSQRYSTPIASVDSSSGHSPKKNPVKHPARFFWLTLSIFRLRHPRKSKKSLVSKSRLQIRKKVEYKNIKGVYDFSIEAVISW